MFKYIKGHIHLNIILHREAHLGNMNLSFHQTMQKSKIQEPCTRLIRPW